MNSILNQIVEERDKEVARKKMVTYTPSKKAN